MQYIEQHVKNRVQRVPFADGGDGAGHRWELEEQQQSEEEKKVVDACFHKVLCRYVDALLTIEVDEESGGLKCG